MKRQAELPLTQPRRARESAHEYRLPDDYGTETDWTPCPIPDDLKIPLIDGEAP